ncbi:phage minor head protein [Bacillus pumilus]|uniref:phage minor head protein n=1 Tax=Bacillus pumilus TaxID=1408 RepID=UPI002281EAFE|nr:phage minor head protein [Bacillus pumilus]MCY7526509.1 phage head morphogenesis protein [Bacillus pumilus]
MSKIDQLIKNINTFVQKAEADEVEELKAAVADFPELDDIPSLVEDYEKTIARLFRLQRRTFLNFISKDDSETLESILAFFNNDLFITDEFAELFGKETAVFLTLTVTQLAEKILDSIDADVPFKVMSEKTELWIESWSQELAQLMKLNTHTAIEQTLKDGIKEGRSIQEIELELKDLPEFSRKRARVTAITEVLTASSVAQHESYVQSPAVTAKQWKHSGGKKNQSRESHVQLDGTIIPLDEEFEIPGSGERCMFPRDTKLSPKERINCHCAVGPVVDPVILGLSAEEKEEIRRRVLQNME